jgi:uncharacterized protein YdhG (YjbR/CyaY superfamily)
MMDNKVEVQKSVPSTRGYDDGAQGFTDQEKAAVRERAKELKAEAKANKDRQEGERAALASIAAMPEPDHRLAARIHEIIKVNIPALWAKTWYGMPAYANEEGKVICFFKNASKFNARYATLGFSDVAKLDEGNMWPTEFALTELTTAEETRIIDLLKKAVS